MNLPEELVTRQKQESVLHRPVLLPVSSSQYSLGARRAADEAAGARAEAGGRAETSAAGRLAGGAAQPAGARVGPRCSEEGARAPVVVASK